LTGSLRGPRAVNTVTLDSGLYFFAHPLGWWNRLADVADVKFYPWRSFGSSHQNFLTPDYKLGRMLFSLLFKLENTFPWLFTNYFQYPMIVMTKK
jgi:hypothetical protein